MKILVVDDEQLIVQGLVKTIRMANIAEGVEGRYNVRDALVEIQNHPPDVLISDICIHDQLGFELIENMRASSQPCRFIIISGYDKFSYAQYALHLGVVEYLLKPVDIGMLLSVLNKIRAELELVSEPEQKPGLDIGSGIPSGISETVHNVLDYIHSHYGEDIYLEQIAGMEGINTSYLSWLFKREVGTNFLNYLHCYRIARTAKFMMQGGSMTVEKISEQFGYLSITHFYKLFKRYMGITPGAFREAPYEQQVALIDKLAGKVSALTLKNEQI